MTLHVGVAGRNLWRRSHPVHLGRSDFVDHALAQVHGRSVFCRRDRPIESYALGFFWRKERSLAWGGVSFREHGAAVVLVANTEWMGAFVGDDIGRIAQQPVGDLSEDTADSAAPGRDGVERRKEPVFRFIVKVVEPTT